MLVGVTHKELNVPKRRQCLKTKLVSRSCQDAAAVAASVSETGRNISPTLVWVLCSKTAENETFSLASLVRFESDWSRFAVHVSTLGKKSEEST